MQIDFHHGVVYLLCRIAGFSAKETSIIAYASQYVDDATNSGDIKFTNGAIYHRINSAHKMIDSRNFNSLNNLQVWMPFHFLPGNAGLKAGKNPDGKFINKLVCTPNSYVAQDMVDHCIKDYDKPYALHRLGITLHVLADTYAHQGFAGVSHAINDVKELNKDIFIYKKSIRKRFMDYITSRFIDNILPLGHGAVLSFPEFPFRKWEYINGMAEKIERNNYPVFKESVRDMYSCIVKFREKYIGDTLDVNIPETDYILIKENIRKFNSEDENIRHENWINSILNDNFSFKKEVNEKIEYIHKGKGSWKYEALNTDKDIDKNKEKFEFSMEFLTSNWKCFHDALQKHRIEVLHDILPKYGICGS